MKVAFVVHHQSFQVVLFLYNFIDFQANTHLNCNNFGCVSIPKAWTNSSYQRYIVSAVWLQATHCLWWEENHCRPEAVSVFLLLCCQLCNFYCKSCSFGVFHFQSGEKYFLLLIKSLFRGLKYWKLQGPHLTVLERLLKIKFYSHWFPLVTKVFITLRRTGGGR